MGWCLMQIVEAGPSGVRITGLYRGVMQDEDQRQLLIWLKDNRLDLVREILCDGCPEVQ